MAKRLQKELEEANLKLKAHEEANNKADQKITTKRAPKLASIGKSPSGEVSIINIYCIAVLALTLIAYTVTLLFSVNITCKLCLNYWNKSSFYVIKFLNVLEVLFKKN